MLADVKSVISRNGPTLWKDALGAVSLMFITLGALHLPGFL